MDIQPILEDGKTHRYWWTCVAAHPLSRDDRWYRALRQVYFDHTTNTRRTKSGEGWNGFYTQGQENHLTVGVFHTFSALPTLHWVDKLLRAYNVEFAPPVTSSRWQYQLQDGCREHGHADIALRVRDSTGEEFALVIETKRKRGRFDSAYLKDPGKYLRLKQVAGIRRKAVVFLVDESDVLKTQAKLPGYSIFSWQGIAKLQLEEISSLALSAVAKSYLRDLMASYLHSFGIAESCLAPALLNEEALDGLVAEVFDQRIAALIRGVDVAVRARTGLDVHAPADWLKDEISVVEQEAAKHDIDWCAELW